MRAQKADDTVPSPTTSRLHSHTALHRKQILFKIFIKVRLIKRHPWGQIQNSLFWVSKRRETMNAETKYAVNTQFCLSFHALWWPRFALQDCFDIFWKIKPNWMIWLYDTWRIHLKLLRAGLCFLHKQNKHKYCRSFVCVYMWVIAFFAFCKWDFYLLILMKKNKHVLYVKVCRSYSKEALGVFYANIFIQWIILYSYYELDQIRSNW